MEKSETGYRDSIENLAFEPRALEPNLLRRGEYVRLPSPQKSVGEAHGGERRRRPISLKADLDMPTSPVRDTGKSQAKKAPQGEKVSESGRRRRPIRLKADLDTATAHVPDANQTQGKTPRQRKKPSESGRRKRPITLKAELDSAEWDVPSTKETPAKEVRQRKDVGEPPRQEEASVEASASPAMPTIDDAPAPSPAPSSMGNAAAVPIEAWLAWAKIHRRLLLVVGLSFIAGIMFRGWFIGEEPPAPREVTQSEVTQSRPADQQPVQSQTMPSQATRQPAPESTGFQRQQIPNAEYAPGIYSQPTPAMGDYPPQNPVQPDPRYDGAWPPQYPSERSPNRGWDDYGYQTAPRTPSPSSSWQSQTIPGYQNPMQQRRFNPWAYEGQQYP